MRCTPRHPLIRRGTALLAAVGVGMLVGVLALGAMVASRSRARAMQLHVDESIARQNALAGVDFARATIAAEPDWRTTYSPEMWLNGVEINGGTLGYAVVNPSGAINRHPLDSVVVTGDGSKGLARQRMSVVLDASKVPLDCLDVALAAGGSIYATSATIQSSGLTIATNAGITSTMATVHPDVEAHTTISGTGFQGTTTPGTATRTLPAASIFDSYAAEAAAIPITSLPTKTVIAITYRQLTDIVLSPNHNPYGSTSTNGVYVIDCQNQVIEITKCRIVGTLVLRNLGAGSRISSGVHWTPAVANYPCVLVEGGISISTNAVALTEGTEATNFNPPGAPHPWPAGSADTDQTDSYTPALDGLVYASGNISVSGVATIDKIISGGTFTVNLFATLTLRDDPAYAADPPPGFYTVKMSPRLGSWAYVIDP